MPMRVKYDSASLSFHHRGSLCSASINRADHGPKSSQ